MDNSGGGKGLKKKENFIGNTRRLEGNYGDLKKKKRKKNRFKERELNLTEKI